LAGNTLDSRKRKFFGLETRSTAEKENFLGWKHARQPKKKIFWAGNTLDSRKRKFFGLETRSTAEKELFLRCRSQSTARKEHFLSFRPPAAYGKDPAASRNAQARAAQGKKTNNRQGA